MAASSIVAAILETIAEFITGPRFARTGDKLLQR
jgi:hypothetical protein